MVAICPYIPSRCFLRSCPLPYLRAHSRSIDVHSWVLSNLIWENVVIMKSLRVLWPAMILSTHENEQRWEAEFYLPPDSPEAHYMLTHLVWPFVVLFCFAMVLKTDLEPHTCLAMWPTTEPHLQLRPHPAWFALSSFFLLWWCQDWTQSMLDEAQSQLLLHSLSLTSMATHTSWTSTSLSLKFSWSSNTCPQLMI